MKNRMRVTLLWILLMLFGCAACSTDTAKPAAIQPGEKRSIVLGFAQVGAESVWRTANTKSIIDAANDAGIDLIFVNAEQSSEKQIKAIRSFIAQQVDVIAFSPNVEDGWDTVLEEAKGANIPVIIVDRAIKTSDNSLFVTYVGSDMREEGRRAGKWLVEKLKNTKEQVNIVELQGNKGSDPAINRKLGFEEIIKPYPNLRIVMSKPADFMRSKGKEVMESFLETMGDDIDVVFAHNDDMAFGAIEAIEEYGLHPGKDILIVSVDAVKEAFEMMIQGKLNCTVECNPLQGPQLMQTVQAIVAGKKLPKRTVIDEDVFPAESAAEELPKRMY